MAGMARARNRAQVTRTNCNGHSALVARRGPSYSHEPVRAEGRSASVVKQSLQLEGVLEFGVGTRKRSVVFQGRVSQPEKQEQTPGTHLLAISGSGNTGVKRCDLFAGLAVVDPGQV